MHRSPCFSNHCPVRPVQRTAVERRVLFCFLPLVRRTRCVESSKTLAHLKAAGFTRYIDRIRTSHKRNAKLLLNPICFIHCTHTFRYTKEPLVSLKADWRGDQTRGSIREEQGEAKRMKTASAKSALLEINYESIPKVSFGQPFFIAHLRGFPQTTSAISTKNDKIFALQPQKSVDHSLEPSSAHSTETRCTAIAPPGLRRWAGLRNTSSRFSPSE